MFRLAEDLRVYLHRDPIDFRCGINSLAILVEQSMGLNPFERAAFAFCNRRRTRMKLLFFDRKRAFRSTLLPEAVRPSYLTLAETGHRNDVGGSGVSFEVEWQQVVDIGVVRSLG